MWLTPASEIGLWNTWILTLYLPLHPLLMLLIIKNAAKKMEAPTYDKTEKIISILTNFVLFFGLFIYSIFLPMQLGTIWLYIGLALCVLGIIVWTIAMVNIANIPLGEPWSRGLYRYSRNPMILSSFLIFVGAGIASTSSVFLLFSIVFIIFSVILVTAEERSCLKRFGDAYREYVNRTPRWIGIPTSRKTKP
jgi:protein-S-isoprenylcysteine O-methyltransferase Ste14